MRYDTDLISCNDGFELFPNPMPEFPGTRFRASSFGSVSCFGGVALVQPHARSSGHYLVQHLLGKFLDNMDSPKDEGTRIAVFQRKEVRRTLHNGEWWFVIADVVLALTDSKDVTQYIHKLRQRVRELA